MSYGNEIQTSKEEGKIVQCNNFQKLRHSAVNCRAASVWRQCADNHDDAFSFQQLKAKEDQSEAVLQSHRKRERERTRGNLCRKTPLSDLLSAFDELKGSLRRKPIVSEIISLKNQQGLNNQITIIC
ncbi:hypothetical protein JTB14_000946 [Gonioctena quinquepunctata]|nr:hypothetical protein JTB14_000946 [Gonioctena quinquepunctata]